MIGQLCENEHFSCVNYKSGPGKSIETVRIEAGGYLDISSSVNKIIFTQRNSMSMSWDTLRDFPIEENHLVFIPSGSEVRLSCGEMATDLVIVKIGRKICMCENSPWHNLFPPDDADETDDGHIGQTQQGEPHHQPFPLEANDMLVNYFDLLASCLEAGLGCDLYIRGKTAELFFILVAFYPQKDITRFMLSAVNSDARFQQLIMSNHSDCKSAQELADRTGYTISGFEKKFRKVFRESPHKWMTRQKTKEILYSISRTSLTISQISDDFGFSSPSAFNDFVKRNSGQTPGQLRKNHDFGGKEE